MLATRSRAITPLKMRGMDRIAQQAAQGDPKTRPSRDRADGANRQHPQQDQEIAVLVAGLDIDRNRASRQRSRPWG
jgi:hypothetical protein